MALRSDDELIRLVKTGRTEAFDLIVDRYYAHVFNFVNRMLRNRADAEDVLQEVFMKASLGLDKYRMEGKFKSWLFTIANNLAVSKLRERKKNGYFSSFRMEEAGWERGVSEDIRDPGRIMEKRELEEVFDKAVDSLSPEQKQVFLLRHVSDLSFKEIAESLNIPLNTALGRMHYALKKLRKIVMDAYPEGGA